MNSTPSFVIDQILVQEIRSRLISVNKSIVGGDENDGLLSEDELPTIGELSELLSVMFWASTQTEEGRSLRFNVTFSKYAPPGELGMPFSFNSLKRWNAEEVRRLAPAVVPPDGHICVGRFRERLYIFGIQTVRTTTVEFEIIDPARILIRFPMGEIIADITGEHYGFIDDNWSNRVFKLLSTYQGDSDNMYVGQMLSHLCGKMTIEVLKRIRLLRHGGTLIFVTPDCKWERSAEKPPYSLRSPYNGLSHISSNLRSDLEGVSESGGGREIQLEIFNLAIARIISSEYRLFMGETARSIAYLTAVDGAVVMNEEFDVLAFGVKIKESVKGQKSQKVRMVYPFKAEKSGTLLPLIDEFRGKRHLSAARFVLGNIGTRAFTVSQDGGITAFIHEEGELRAFRNMELVL